MTEKKLFTFEQVKQKMINYCVYQDRAHKEVEQKMKEYVLIPEARDEILLYLIKENFLNEERFARSYTRGKFYIKNWGRTKIRIHLLQKGISDKLISKSFEEIDEQDYQNTINKLIEKANFSYNNIKNIQKKNKIIHFLVSKGYEYELVIKSLES